VVWLRKTDKFAALKAELGAARTDPYESTEYQGMIDFDWSAANLPEAKRLAEALKGAIRHPELVLLRIMSRVAGPILRGTGKYARALCRRERRAGFHND
jgi:hypothetical protein